jgi:hypothetical protein
MPIVHIDGIGSVQLGEAYNTLTPDQKIAVLDEIIAQHNPPRNLSWFFEDDAQSARDAAARQTRKAVVSRKEGTASKFLDALGVAGYHAALAPKRFVEYNSEGLPPSQNVYGADAAIETALNAVLLGGPKRVRSAQPEQPVLELTPAMEAPPFVPSPASVVREGPSSSFAPRIDRSVEMRAKYGAPDDRPVLELTPEMQWRAPAAEPSMWKWFDQVLRRFGIGGLSFMGVPGPGYENANR